MRRITLFAVAALAGSLVSVAPARADSVPPVTVLETAMPWMGLGPPPDGFQPSVQYTLTNQSNQTKYPFDMTLLVVSTTGSDPTTTNANWTAEALTAASWDLPMGGPGSTLPTWQQYTGLTYHGAGFAPADPCNGYFLNFTFDAMSGDVATPTDPCLPGSSLGGFFFTGSPGSTFLVAGPDDSSSPFPLGQVNTYSGTATDAAPVPLPTPAYAIAMLLGIWGTGKAWNSRKRARST